MEITTRARAIERGDTLYYTGERCRNGHLAPRYVHKGECMVCRRLSLKQSNRRLAALRRRMRRVAAQDVPCEPCPERAYCAATPAACEAFLRYVNGVVWGGTRRQPTPALFERIFSNQDAES
jgi:hypothetical protein